MNFPASVNCMPRFIAFLTPNLGLPSSMGELLPLQVLSHQIRCWTDPTLASSQGDGLLHAEPQKIPRECWAVDFAQEHDLELHQDLSSNQREIQRLDFIPHFS